MTAPAQTPLSDYQKRQGHFARVRALIMKTLHAEDGLTIEEIGKRVLLAYGFLPRINNRVRELRKLGWVETRKEDGLLHVYIKKETES